MSVANSRDGLWLPYRGTESVGLIRRASQNQQQAWRTELRKNPCIHACKHTYIHTYKHTHTRTYIHTAQAAEQGQGLVAGSQKPGGCCWLWDPVPPLTSLSSRLSAHLPPQIQDRVPVSNQPSARGSCPPAARERGEAGIGRSPSKGKWTFFADASPLNSAQTQLPLTPSKDPGKQDSGNSLGRYSTCSLLQKVSRDTGEVWATGAALRELRH